MKNFLSFLGVIAFIAMLIAVCSLLFDVTNDNEQDKDKPGDSMVEIPDDTNQTPPPDTDDGDGTEDSDTPTVNTITVIRKHSQGGAAGCSCGQCPLLLEYTFEIQEGDTFNTLTEREWADGDYTGWYRECETDGVSELTSIDGAQILDTTDGVYSDGSVELVAGAIYVDSSASEYVFYVVGKTCIAEPGMTWQAYCDSKWNTLGLYYLSDGEVMSENGQLSGLSYGDEIEFGRYYD